MANQAAEKLLLAGLFKYPDEFFQYCMYLDEHHFSTDGARDTWLAYYSLMMNKDAQSISKAKLVSEAKAIGCVNYLAKIRNGEWLDELFSESVSADELAQHFLEVKRQHLIGSYSQATENVRQYLKTTKDPLSKIISTVEDKVVSQVTMLDKGEHAIVPLMRDARSKIEQIAKDPGQPGLDLGYPIWQNRVGQLRNGSVTLLVGTTGSGKSQFAAKAALLAALKQDIPVLYLDSELNANDQLTRVVGMLAKVSYQYIETGYWKMSERELRKEGITDQVDLDELAQARVRMQDDHLWQVAERLPIEYVSISGMGVQEVLPHIRRWLLTRVKPDRKCKVPQCLIVYDYIKLATIDELGGGRFAEWQMHGLNVASLHDLVTKYNVPCLAFGQTNNEADDGLHCVAGGKRISENVTSVSYFKRKSDDERSFDSAGSHYIRVWKARYGRGTFGGYINYNVDLSCGDFVELGIGYVNFAEEKRKRIEAWKQKKSDDN